MDDRGFSHNCTWVGNPALPVDTTTYPTSSNFHSTTSYSSTSLSFAGLDLLFELKPLFVPLYSMVILVACSGNLFLLVLIGLNRKRHNTTNFLIGNLALVDLVMCIICVPLTASYAFDRRGWLYGHFMCHFATLMQSAAVFAAVLSLAAIAVDRYVVVAYPIRRRLGCKFCWSLVAVIWLFSLALSTPTALHTSYLDLSATGIHMSVCEEFWHGEEIGRIVYSGFVPSFSYFVPSFSYFVPSFSYFVPSFSYFVPSFSYFVPSFSYFVPSFSYFVPSFSYFVPSFSYFVPSFSYFVPSFSYFVPSFSYFVPSFSYFVPSFSYFVPSFSYFVPSFSYFVPSFSYFVLSFSYFVLSFSYFVLSFSYFVPSFSYFVPSFSYFVPLIAVSVSHLAISYHLRRRKISSLMATGPASNQINWGRKRRKTFCLLLGSVLCFAFSWLPLQVVNLIRDLDTDFTILEKNHVNVIQVSCHLFAMSSTCYNPFIYASLHDKFLSFLCQRFFFPRHRWEGGRGPGTSLSTSHHLTRVYKLR